jgi:hypothetical protein
MKGSIAALNEHCAGISLVKPAVEKPFSFEISGQN